MIATEELSDPAVRAVVAAIDTGDRATFLSSFTDDATMADDGVDRDFQDWIDSEIFDSNGRMEVESQSEDGRSLIARFRNDTYGEMRTSWRFEIVDGKVSRMEAGQA